jgi:hypothetical protein
MRDERLLNETWKKLNIEGLAEDESYDVSDHGRIRSYKSHPEGQIIKGSLLKGYQILNVKLATGKRTTKYIHKLVAEHFIDKDSDLQLYVIHVDFDKSNNHVSNLKWVTKQTMFAHQKINPNYKRGMINNAKLTVSEVISLKKKLQNATVPFYKIAEEFGITHTQLNRIRKGENWGNVKIDD